MARDYYAEAREVARMLEQDGLAAEAQELVDTIRFGFAASEILGELRMVLRRILRSKPKTSTETMRRMRSLCSGMARALDS